MDDRGLTPACGGCADRRAWMAGLWAAIDPTKAINLHSTRSANERLGEADLIGGAIVQIGLTEAIPLNWSGGSGVVQVVFVDDSVVRTAWTTTATFTLAGTLALTFSSEFGSGGVVYRECGNFLTTPPDDAKNVFHPDEFQFVSFGTLPSSDPGELTAIKVFDGTGKKLFDTVFGTSCRDSPIQDDRRYGMILQSDTVPAFGSQAGGTMYPMCLGGTTTFTNEKTLTVTATVSKTAVGLQFKEPGIQRPAVGLTDDRQDDSFTAIGFDFWDTVAKISVDPCWYDIPANLANDPIGRIRVTDNGASFTYAWDMIWEDGQEPTFSGSVMNF